MRFLIKYFAINICQITLNLIYLANTRSLKFSRTIFQEVKSFQSNFCLVLLKCLSLIINEVTQENFTANHYEKNQSSYFKIINSVCLYFLIKKDQFPYLGYIRHFFSHLPFRFKLLNFDFKFFSNIIANENSFKKDTKYIFLFH